MTGSYAFTGVCLSTGARRVPLVSGLLVPGPFLGEYTVRPARGTPVKPTPVRQDRGYPLDWLHRRWPTSYDHAGGLSG